MKKFIISGGPHTGKTTLLEALKLEMPDIYFVTEPATNIINRESMKERSDSNYKGKFPWSNYNEFADLVIKESLDLEKKIPHDCKIAVLDRSLIDTVAYARLSNAEQFVELVQNLTKKADYDTVFFCDFVGEYTKTDVRHEDEELAKKTHEFLYKAYKESGINFIKVPEVSIEDRVKILKKFINKGV